MESSISNNTSSTPFVSVVIPVRNSPQRIAKCLENLLNQTYPKDFFEIIVVDNGSTDETPDVIQKYPVKYLEESSVRNPYAARNKGIQAAKGEIIAMIDANCFAYPQWLEHGIEKMRRENADLMGGKVVFLFLGKKKTVAEMYDSITNIRMKESIEGRKVAKGGNLFVWKRVFDSIGLFPGNVRSGIDVLWTGRATRAGFKLVYSDAAEVSYPARELLPLLKKCYRVGQGQLRIWRAEGVSPIRTLKRIIRELLPSGISPIRRRIKKNGSTDMARQFWRIWFVAWMCSITSSA
ncbi:MAG: glycosyltransferase, partial [Candidatus Heimdallarchaeota archaeon]|nr:glycosyltransferase [Candidatus Heimdallarchaeota archaeon]